MSLIGNRIGIPYQNKGAIFNPASLPNLFAWYDPNDRSTVLADGAADFTDSSSQSLRKTSGVSLAVNNDFTCAGWVQLKDNSNTYQIFGLGNDFKLYNTPTKLYFERNGGNLIISALPAGAYYFVAFGYRNGVAFIKLNADASVTSGSGFNAGTRTNINMGVESNGASGFLNGKMDSWAIYGKGLSDTEIETIRNGGEGKVYADLTPAEKTNLALISWWDLDEETGIRYDAHGTNHLQPSTSSPAFGAGIVAGQARDGNYARGFDGVNDKLKADSPSDFVINSNQSFEINGWYMTTSTSGYPFIFGKGNATSGGGEYTLWITSSATTHSLSWSIRNSANNNDNIVNAISIVNSIWKNYSVGYDATTKKMYLYLDNVLIEEKDITTPGIFTGGTNVLAFGARDTGSNPMEGRLDTTVFATRTLTPTERTALFNNGKSVKYRDMPTSIKNDSAIKAVWDMEGATSTNESDMHGSNNLTQSGGVTRTRGVNYYGGVVSKLLDKSGNGIHLTQPTFASRPVIVLNTTTNKYELEFDGVDDYLVSANFATKSTLTVYNAFLPTSISNLRLITFGNSLDEILFAINKIQIRGQGNITGTLAVTADNNYLHTAKFNGANSAQKINGTEETGLNIVSTIATKITLGARESTLLPFVGTIKETIIYSVINNASEQAKVEKYLKNKHKLY